MAPANATNVRRRLLSSVLLTASLWISSSTASTAFAATITNLNGVYDTSTNRILISFSIQPAPSGVDSFYFDLDVFPSPPVFDPSSMILFSTVPGATIDQFFQEESIWIDFPVVLTSPLDYSIVIAVADASAIAGPLNIDMYLNPQFGDRPSALQEWAFPDIMTMETGRFTPGSIVIPEPSTLALTVMPILHSLFTLSRSPLKRMRFVRRSIDRERPWTWIWRSEAMRSFA